VDAVRDHGRNKDGFTRGERSVFVAQTRFNCPREDKDDLLSTIRMRPQVVSRLNLEVDDSRTGIAGLMGALAMIEKPCNTVTVALPWAML